VEGKNMLIPDNPLNIGPGDIVKVFIPGYFVIGIVDSVDYDNYRKTYNIELTDSDGMPHYWKQFSDGGSVILLESN
jgi:hypothetical protein